MEKQLINEIARIKELLSTNQLITESVPAKTVREIFKSLGEINFKKLFSFATEEDVKLIKTSKNINKVEATFEKLIKSVNWGSLAKDIIGRELFGPNFAKILNNEIQKVGKGIKTKEESIKAFDSFLDTYSATKNLDNLKKSLISEIESKLDDAVKKIPDTSGVLSQEAQSIFNAFGKTMSTKQAEFLNGIAKKINKLTPTELLQANNELKNIAAGTVQDAITRLSQAKDIISKTKAEKYQKLLEKVKDYLNMSTKAVGGVNKTYLIKAIITLVVLCLLMGIWQLVKDTRIGKMISSGGSAISDTVLPGDTTTPDNGGTYQGLDDNGNPIFK
jgi:hypothetical protein